MGLQDRDYVQRSKSSDNAIEEFERSAREDEYGQDGGPSTTVRVITLVLVVLMVLAFVGSC